MTTDLLERFHVLLPVFKDNAGRYQPPKDVIDLEPSPTRVANSAMAPQSPQWGPNPNGQRLIERMNMVSMRQQPQQPKPQRQQRANSSHSSAAISIIATPNVAPDNNPLWGENRGFAHQYVGSSSASDRSEPESQEDAFPALSTATKTPTVAPPTKGMSRRVMRINSQKASTPSPTAANGTLLEMAKEYNLHNMKTALQDGLEGVRGFAGEIKLGAKLGKVLWRNLSGDVQKKIWEFRDIKDIVMKEHGVRPVFSDM